MATDGKKKSKSARTAEGKAQRAKVRERDAGAEPEVRGKDGKKQSDTDLLVPGENLIGPGGALVVKGPAPVEEGDGTPADLGATKYVHAAFFAAGILVAYLTGKLLALIWSRLVEAPWAVEAVPQLLSVGENRRITYTMIVGVAVGIVTVILTYRKAAIRQWADEVALELSRVTWPDRDTVTNGTIVVIVATVVATVYVALLDRVWAFLTSLIYGA